MAETFRCPNCGALNPTAAEWCGQCLTRFRKTPPPPPPRVNAPAPGAAAPAAGAAAAFETSVQPGSHVAPKAEGPFTVTEAGITWRCAQCENENPLEAQVCAVCGTTFADTVRPPKETPQRDPNTVALYSLFFPGAGHWQLDMRGQAVARGVLNVWVIFVAVVAAIQGSMAMAVPFGVAAFALWGLAAHDAYREARREGDQVILKGRAFLYVVFGLLLLMVILLVATSLSARA